MARNGSIQSLRLEETRDVLKTGIPSISSDSPALSQKFWWKASFVNWSPEARQSVLKNAKHIAINIYTAYVLYNISHVCLHSFTSISFKVVSNCVQCVGGFCFSISPFGILS